MTPDLAARPFIVDLHCDTLGVLEREGRTLRERSPRGHLDLPRLGEGGVRVQFFALFVPRRQMTQATAVALSMIELFYRQLERSAAGEDSRRWRPAGDFAEVEAAIRDGGGAACLSLEGGEPLAGDLSVLRVLRRLGVVAVGLTWNNRNDLGCGCLDGETEGLTAFGRAVVAEAASLRMMVDVAHLNRAGFWEVLEVSPVPVIASHANAHALCPHPRNLDDGQVAALAAKGGVLGLTFVPDFLAPGGNGACRAKLLDHLDHVVGIAGTGAVGLGSDFDGIESTPPGLEDAAALAGLDEDLLQRGYKEEEVAAILGGNWLRVMRETMGENPYRER